LIDGSSALKHEFYYMEDIDPVSGAPTITAVPKTVAAARQGVPYNIINSFDEIFKPENLREAWRLMRRNDPFDYQLEVADAILYSCLNKMGWYFVVMISRQAGKNEISAFIQQYLLLYGWYFGVKVSGVKFAPVYKPQVQASMDRLEGADTPDSGGLSGSVLTKDVWQKSDGYKYHIGTPRDTNKWAFLSIGPRANVASQTALTLLEGDEAQDIDTDKWERDAQPMGGFNNATTAFYGVAWTKVSHIYQALTQAYDMEVRLEKELGYRPKLVFKVDAYRVIASGNESYKKAFESQVARLGINHIAIQTQYLLNFIDSIGRFFDAEQMARIYANSYRPRVGPERNKIYVFGLDVAGQEENPTTAEENIGEHKRDATNLVIGELMLDGAVVPVCPYQWVGKAHSQQREQMLAIIKHWGCIGGSGDATGIGEPLMYWLIESLPNLEIEAYKFKAAGDENKSKLGYLAYNYVTADRFKVPQIPAGYSQAQRIIWEELRWQLENLVREAKKEQRINWHVPGNSKPRFDGHVPHDDLATACFLLIRAAYYIRNPNSRKAQAFDRTGVM